jgi:hypothetical protein
VFASRCSIDITLWTGWFRSTSATAARAADARPAGAPAVRITKLIAPPAFSMSGWYASSVTPLSRPRWRTLPATPTTVSHGPSAGEFMRRCLPIALSPGK